MRMRPWVGAPSTWFGWIFTIGLYEIWRRRNHLELREHELLHAHGVVSRHDRVLPIARVQDVTVSRILWWARLTVSTAGGGSGLVKTGPYSVGRARRFAADLRERTAQLHHVAPI